MSVTSVITSSAPPSTLANNQSCALPPASVSAAPSSCTVAPGPFLDGDPALDRYAARIVDTGAGLVLLGFLHNPGGGPFVGEIADPAPVTIDADGWLRVG